MSLRWMWLKQKRAEKVVNRKHNPVVTEIKCKMKTDRLSVNESVSHSEINGPRDPLARISWQLIEVIDDDDAHVAASC